MGKNLLLIILLAFAGSNLLHAQCDILLWSEEFDADTLRTDRWNILSDNSGGGNNELQYYTSRDTNVSVEDGWLVIRALKEQYENREYTSAKITTKGLGDWKYGRIEARIKTPEGQGMWPAFWMMPSDNVYGTWPASGEIDIMELIGHEPSVVYGTLHYGPPHNYTNGSYTLSEGKFSDSAHVFAIEWSQDTIKWFVDDVLYSQKTAEDLERPEQWAAFNERFYVILNLAVGGDWPGNPDESTVFPQTMEVDYVRVYGDPVLGEITAADSAYAMAEGVRYSFSDIPGANFTWQVPQDAVITEGQGTHSILVDWGCTPGNIQLEVTGIDCEDQSYSLPVSFSEPSVTGPDKLFPLDSAWFSLPSLAGTSYQWEMPDDASVINDQEDSLLVRWGCEEGYLKFGIENQCMSYYDSVLVSLKEPQISGPSTVSEFSRNIMYKIDPLSQTDYSWTVPADAVVAQGMNNDSVFVDFGVQPGDVSVELNNVCGISSFSLAIRITDTILLADYETMSPEFLTFSSSTFEVVGNPQQDYANPSENVGKSFKSEVAWSGIYTDLGFNLDLTDHKKFSLKVLGPKAGVVLLKLEDIEEGDVQPVEVPADYTTPGEWQVLEYDFPSAPSEAFDRITLFFDFGSETENIFYFDDLYLLPTSETGRNDLLGYPEMQVYPNPFSEEISIRTKDEIIEHLQLLDSRGKVLLHRQGSGNEEFLNLNFLSQGVYLLRISTEKKVYSKMIIKH